MTRTALITGVAGQVGSFLAEHLLQQGYDVYGTLHRNPRPEADFAYVSSDVRILRADLRNQRSLIRAIEVAQPDEVYNLGAISFVPTSFDQPETTTDVNGLGVLRMLESIRCVAGLDLHRSGLTSDIRFYQASSSEMFGGSTESRQSEHSALNPKSPYGAAKVYGHHMTQYYREAYGLFAVSGICFNHESERRDRRFVTRKVTSSAARIKLGLDSELSLGNLGVIRDWGFAGDYVKAMYLMLQAPAPEDYVIGTGVSRSVRDLVELAFSYLDLDWQQYVRQEPHLRRVPEVNRLVADPRKINELLGWHAEVNFTDLILRMVEADLKLTFNGADG